jgi:5-methylcytosine-specific restriction enzyme A
MTPSTIFDGSDGAGEELYQSWLQAHPTGLVLNSRREIDPSYMVLHRATCHSIRHPTRSQASDPFTGRGYIKVCADSREHLIAWIAGHGSSGFSKVCGLCGP